MVPNFEPAGCLVLIVLMNNILTHMSMIMENELLITLLTIPRTASSANWDAGMNTTRISLITKMNEATRSIHLMYGDVLSFVFSSSLCPKIFVIPMMHHPRISVVTTVEMHGTRYSDLMTAPRTSAPRVPSMYPSMFAMIMTAAVNSTLSPLFMQMIRAIAIVRTVSSSSSVMPAMRQPSATAACINAKMCIIQDINMHRS